MLEPALHRRLAQESRDRTLARIRRAHPLDRDVAADLLVARGHHLAHAALADPATEPIATFDELVGRWLAFLFRLVCSPVIATLMVGDSGSPEDMPPMLRHGVQVTPGSGSAPPMKWRRPSLSS